MFFRRRGIIVNVLTLRPTIQHCIAAGDGSQVDKHSEEVDEASDEDFDDEPDSDEQLETKLAKEERKKQLSTAGQPDFLLIRGTTLGVQCGAVEVKSPWSYMTSLYGEIFTEVCPLGEVVPFPEKMSAGKLGQCSVSLSCVDIS